MNVMLIWTIAITHAFFVLFAFDETTHHKFKVKEFGHIQYLVEYIDCLIFC